MLIPFPFVVLFIFALALTLCGWFLSPKAPTTKRKSGPIPSHYRTPPRNGSSQRIQSRRGMTVYNSKVQMNAVQSSTLTWTGVRNVVSGSFNRLPGWLQVVLVLMLTFALIGFLLTHILVPQSNQQITLSTQAATNATVTPSAQQPEIPSGVTNASKVLKRLAQMDRGQYSSDDEYNTWAASACSATSMTVAIDAYGHDYRISDILKTEIAQHAISPDLGLLEPSGIDRTVAQFGFHTAQMSKAPLDSLIAVANNGWPIIIGFPPGKHWPGGHILVVTGGDNDSVFLADSAPTNYTSMSHDRFMQDWGGMAFVIMPKNT